MSEIRPDGGRRRGKSKGDLREEAILNAAERQLAETEYERITVATLMDEVGGSRGGFYFYFSTKADVVAALVERTVAALHVSPESLAGGERDLTPMQLIGILLAQTEAMWAEHGPVMSAAVELSPTVPSISASWSSAAEAVTRTATQIAVRAGLDASSAPEGAAATSAMLVWMAERAYYQARRLGTPTLPEVTAACEAVWRRCLTA